MWKKDGQLVFPESGSGLDILQQGGVLTVEQARPSHSGEWECIASTAWGEDTILYWLSVPSRRHAKKPCSVRVPPVITEIISTSNTSVVLEWDVLNFNSSCFQEFMIFWWSKEEDSTHDNQTIELKHRKATIIGLKPDVAYYFQVNLVRDRSLKDYMYGQTKSHMMQFTEKSELSSDSNPKAVIIIVIIVIVLLLTLLVLLYIKRDRVSKFLAQRTKTRKHSEFSEFSSKLVANPDFMASLAPQWPEPEPEPSEAHAFIQHQVVFYTHQHSFIHYQVVFNTHQHSFIHYQVVFYTHPHSFIQHQVFFYTHPHSFIDIHSSIIRYSFILIHIHLSNIR